MSAPCPTLYCPDDSSDQAVLYSVEKSTAGGASTGNCPVINCINQLGEEADGDYQKYSIQMQLYPVIIPLDWSIPSNGSADVRFFPVPPGDGGGNVWPIPPGGWPIPPGGWPIPPGIGDRGGETQVITSNTIHLVFPGLEANPDIDIARNIPQKSTFDTIRELLAEMLKELAAISPFFKPSRYGPTELFTNVNKFCTFNSSSGLNYTFIARRGMFFALTQAKADAAAGTWACLQARLIGSSKSTKYSKTDFGWGFGL